jgi:hypothetical protein
VHLDASTHEWLAVEPMPDLVAAMGRALMSGSTIGRLCRSILCVCPSLGFMAALRRSLRTAAWAGARRLRGAGPIWGLSASLSDELRANGCHVARPFSAKFPVASSDCDVERSIDERAGERRFDVIEVDPERPRDGAGGSGATGS